MRHLWACGSEGCHGTEVQRALEPEHPLALTTILTTLDRLLAKGIVRRERGGKAYLYWAVFSEDQLQQRIVEGIMERLIAQFPKAVAAYFAQQGQVGEAAQSELHDLVRRVEAATAEPDDSMLDAQPHEVDTRHSGENKHGREDKHGH
jgi:predicted transcriptional regulator